MQLFINGGDTFEFLQNCQNSTQIFFLPMLHRTQTGKF